jgi:hypothetical protein
MISQTLKDNSEMFGVIFLALRIDENIIDKDHDKFIKLCHEHRVHEVHEVGGGISESERHYQELVKCRMDLPGPTASVGTRTDYSVGPWDYLACAARHLKAWSTRTAQE